MPPTTQLNAQTMSTQLTQAMTTLRTLSFNIQFLKANRSADKLQQAQSEAIIQLYDAVRQIQDALWPLQSLLVPPGISGAREAAQNAGGNAPALSAAALSSTSTTANPSLLKRSLR